MRTGREALAYLWPALLLVCGVVLVPLFFVIYTSLYANGLTLEAYGVLLKSTLFQRSLFTTIEISVTAALASLLLGYPVALHLARQSPRRRAFFMILVLVPFWTSILVKSYAFTLILGKEGFINQVLTFVFGSQATLQLMFNRIGVIVGMTNYLVPFVVFPVLASLLAIDKSVYRAAEIMGARPPRIFWRITLPLSFPGVASALISTFVMSAGFFVIPALLGGRKDVMMANLVDFYTRETLDWNLASAIGVILLAIATLAAGASFASRSGARFELAK
jgi:putative spermidine/putrescine transport system permease protein/mannopine transport system permease protein